MKKVLLIMSLFLFSCSFRPYTAKIEQGQDLTAKQIEMLKPNMTKKQVKYILGTPNVKTPLQNDIWLYVWTFQKNQFSFREQKQLVIKFNSDGKLEYLSGDYPPPQEIYNVKG